MVKTELCDLFGIEYPLFQGGMAWISNASLASAVSNAGGLGIISAMNAHADSVREEIRACKKATTKPFGVNIMLQSRHADDVAQVVIEEGVQVVTTGAGLPNAYMEDWLGAGIKVVPVVASTGFAKMCQRVGATALIAEGCESGGHIGELTTMALVPQVVDVATVPVLAAGGIGDGRGVAAALMLGAVGVQCGTCFLPATECTVHPTYKSRVIKAKDIDTVATGKRGGHLIRALKNPFTHKYTELQNDPLASEEEIGQFSVGALRKAAIEGNSEEGSFLAGQIAGLVTEERSANEIISSMFSQAEVLLRGAHAWTK